MNKYIKKIMENELFKKYVNKETILYLVFGVLTTIVNYVVFWISDEILGEKYYLVSTWVAWILAVLFAFVTNKIYVFESKKADLKTLSRELFSFTVARILSLVFQLIFMYVTVDLLKINRYIAMLVSNVFVMIMNYFFSKLFIFKKEIKNK